MWAHLKEKNFRYLSRCQYRDNIASMTEWLMNMEQLVEWKLAGDTEVFREDMPQYPFVQHKSYVTWDITRAIALGSRRLTAWAIMYLLRHISDYIFPLTTLLLRSTIFSDITLCILNYLLHAVFLIGFFLFPEDGIDMFLRNVSCISTDYTAIS
jgi:hypothetical protein